MTVTYDQADGGQSGTTQGSPSPAAATLETAADQAGELKHQAAEEVGSVVDTAKGQVSTLADEARNRARDEARNATTRAAAALSDTAGELTAMASNVDDPGPAARTVRMLGERVDGAADRLRREGYEGVARDVSRWARQNPGLFLMAAAGAGFVVGRVFRSVDPKSVADAARGASTTSDQPAIDLTGTPGMYPSPTDIYAPTPEPTIPPGIDVMTPPVDAPLATNPQPHPDASAPIVNMTDPVGEPIPRPGGAGFAGGPA